MTAGGEGRGGWETAFAVGGGSSPGAHGIAMMRPLFGAGIRPDLVAGTSAGAVNAALVAAFPGAAAVQRLVAVWNGLARTGVFGACLLGRIGTAMRSGAHLYSSVPLRALVESSMPARRIVHVLLIGRPGPDCADLTQQLRYRSASLTRPGPALLPAAPMRCLPGLAHTTK
jgi:hypothetical protein